jgi:hypothetical protein
MKGVGLNSAPRISDTPPVACSEWLYDLSPIKCDCYYCRFAKNNVMRVYPYGLRFDSSNLDPTKAWAYGAQLAAINMQVRFRVLGF